MNYFKILSDIIDTKGDLKYIGAVEPERLAQALTFRTLIGKAQPLPFHKSPMGVRDLFRQIEGELGIDLHTLEKRGFELDVHIKPCAEDKKQIAARRFMDKCTQMIIYNNAHSKQVALAQQAAQFQQKCNYGGIAGAAVLAIGTATLSELHGRIIEGNLWEAALLIAGASLTAPLLGRRAHNKALRPLEDSAAKCVMIQWAEAAEKFKCWTTAFEYRHSEFQRQNWIQPLKHDPRITVTENTPRNDIAAFIDVCLSPTSAKSDQGFAIEIQPTDPRSGIERTCLRLQVLPVKRWSREAPYRTL